MLNVVLIAENTMQCKSIDCVLLPTPVHFNKSRLQPSVLGVEGYDLKIHLSLTMTNQ